MAARSDVNVGRLGAWAAARALLPLCWISLTYVLTFVTDKKKRMLYSSARLLMLDFRLVPEW